MLKNKIFWPILLAGVLLSGYFLVPRGEGRSPAYQSGEAVNFNNRVIIATVDTGSLDIFQVVDDSIRKTNSIRSDAAGFPEFADVALKEQNRRLYAYATNRGYIYQYDISNPDNIELLAKKQDNSGDRFYALGEWGERMYSVGSLGVKVWSQDLKVVNSYNLHTTIADNIAFTDNGNYIFHLLNNNFRIIDSFYRNPVMEAALNIREDHSRNIFSDGQNGAVYVVDDFYLKKFSFNGLQEKFRHISHLGYDVDGTQGSDHIYFSDGVGIVKSGKTELEPLTWRYTTDLGGGEGWAMGLRAVRYGSGERVVVFNGSSILLFDQDLGLLDYYRVPERPDSDYQSPYLRVDRSRAAPGSRISVRGGGFGPDERLIVDFAGEKHRFYADQAGGFSEFLTVPAVKSGVKDVKVTGSVSGVSYSLSFVVE